MLREANNDRAIERLALLFATDIRASLNQERK